MRRAARRRPSPSEPAPSDATTSRRRTRVKGRGRLLAGAEGRSAERVLPAGGAGERLCPRGDRHVQVRSIPPRDPRSGRQRLLRTDSQGFVRETKLASVVPDHWKNRAGSTPPEGGAAPPSPSTILDLPTFEDRRRTVLENRRRATCGVVAARVCGGAAVNENTPSRGLLGRGACDFDGGPRWTRTTDLTVISRAL